MYTAKIACNAHYMAVPQFTLVPNDLDKLHWK